MNAFLKIQTVKKYMRLNIKDPPSPFTNITPLPAFMICFLSFWTSFYAFTHIRMFIYKHKICCIFLKTFLVIK